MWIDYRAVRSQIPMERVLELLDYHPTSRRGHQLRGACPFHSPERPNPRCFSVELKKGQMVILDPNAHVEVDPTSVIHVEAAVKNSVPVPSDRQLQVDAADSKNGIFGTSYTVFKTIEYKSGFVVTGWQYDVSQPNMPRHQYCYYTRTVDPQANFRVDLGRDGLLMKSASATVLGRDASEAFGLCVWNYTN